MKQAKQLSSFPGNFVYKMHICLQKLLVNMNVATGIQ